QQDRPWEIALVNLQDLLRPLDIFRKLTGIPLEDIYNLMLAKGWTLGAGLGLRAIHAAIRTYHRATVRLLEKYWNETQPDLVVSLVPNFNREMREALAAARPGIPFVTILTDFADYPPHFWIEEQKQYFICGTDKAVEQARALGHASGHIFRVSGMILRPGFYESIEVDRGAQRSRLGLDRRLPTGLVLFGGQGSKVMLEIARRLDNRQLIFICGRNQRLAEQLRATAAAVPRVIEGFTNEIPYYMDLADYFIGKPGPGSVSEAVAMKLPVIVESNAWTLPQERYNAEWIRERGVGIVLPNFLRIGEAVSMLLGSLEQYRASVERIENRAVFEIPEILESLLKDARAGGGE
ncbi:MAG: galactosyldiacylglycerol synthase, partial [Bryobacteraceae bacterium]